MSRLLKDLKYTWRLLLGRPGFTIAVVLTLCLGIGANAAIFSVIYAVVLRPLPYEDPGELTILWANFPKKKMDPVTPADYTDWRENNEVFERLAAYCYQNLSLTGDGSPEQLTAASVTSNFFPTFGVPPVLGKTFQEGAGGFGEDLRLVVLSHRLWQRRFGGDPEVVGKRLTFNGMSYLTIGVMPQQFQMPDRAELWVPSPRDIPVLNPSEDPEQNFRSGYLRVVGRLKESVSLRQAQNQMDTIALRRAQEYPDTNAEMTVDLVPLHEQVVGNVRPSLVVLAGAVGFVLLIACANVANLLLLRAGSRSREIALRLAFGARRRRVVGQLLTESVLLGLLSGLVGLLVAYWAVRGLVWLSPADTPRIHEASLDGMTVAFTFALSLFTGVLFGLLPAFQTTRVNLREALSVSGTRSSEGRQGVRLRGLLVVLEVALAIVLLVGAGLMIKSFSRLQEVDSGIDPEGLVAARIVLPREKYPEGHQRADFYRQAVERIKAIPGVKSASGILTHSMSGDDINAPFSIEGRTIDIPGERPRDGYQVALPGYFETMGIPILSGRDFNAGDTTEAPGVAIISSAMAKRYWPDQNALGQRITYDDPANADAKWLTIVGIVGSVRFGGPDGVERAELFMPHAQQSWSRMSLVVRTNPDVEPARIVPALRAAVADVDAEQPIAGIAEIEELIAESVARPFLISRLLTAFAGLALVLAAIGIYSVIAFVVSQRTREIGVRIALGAAPGALIQQVLNLGLALAGIGIALGILGAFGLSRLLASLLFEVSATDPLTFVLIPLVLLVVSLLACMIPAYRASRIQPAIALRAD